LCAASHTHTSYSRRRSCRYPIRFQCPPGCSHLPPSPNQGTHTHTHTRHRGLHTHTHTHIATHTHTVDGAPPVHTILLSPVFVASFTQYSRPCTVPPACHFATAHHTSSLIFIVCSGFMPLSRRYPTRHAHAPLLQITYTHTHTHTHTHTADGAPLLPINSTR
jgi:hypothetical protein